MGKSSFISWICWNYEHKKEDNTVKELFANSILVLEGFDELCMLESIVGQGKGDYFYNLYQELTCMDCNCKIIVTTRPDYLMVEKLDFPKAHFVISPFSKDKRKEWLDKYACYYQIPFELRKILIQNSTPILDGIVDSPLTLYMIVARNISILDNSNLWYIYHEIFAKEVYERDYEKGAPHAINTYRELLFRLTAEIANAVSHEQHLSITIEKLLDIKQIRNLLKQLGVGEKNNIKDILADCFGIASYFRISEKEHANGKIISAVEFYHNNIKDYFYCEYLWLHLENMYANIPSTLQQQEEWFISSFQKLFQYSICLKDTIEGVRARALDFLESKILYLKANNIQVNFICQEFKKHYFPHFFGKMLQTGFLSRYEYTGKDNVLNMILCIYTSVFSLYHTIYLSYLANDLANDEQIVLTDELNRSDFNTNLIYRILFTMARLHDLSHTRFDGMILRGIKLKKYNFKKSSFVGCILDECIFDECDLRGANFTSASLLNTDFRKAIIDSSTVFSKTTFFGHTKINRDQFPYFAPWVGENLFYSDIESVTYIGSKLQ